MGMHSTLRVNHARLARTPWASACTGTVPTPMECTARPLPSLWQISTAPLPAHEPASDTCRHCQEWEEDFQRPRKHVISDTTLDKSVLGASCLCWKRGPDVACAAYCVRPTVRLLRQLKHPFSLARTHVLRLLKHPFHLHAHTFCIC